jgi:hypothetical protein
MAQTNRCTGSVFSYLITSTQFRSPARGRSENLRESMGRREPGPQLTVLNANEGDSCGIDGCDQTAYNMDNINTILPAWWGILGCGDVTEKKWSRISKTEGFVSAVMRRDAEKRLTAPTAIKNITRCWCVNQRSRNRCIYIATPPDVHKYYALK